jgi:diguanylate cyclase (GGDEF)-like protein
MELLAVLAAFIDLAIARAELLGRERHQGMHDALTGLANRTLFLDRLEHALARRDRHGRSLAVYFLDIDRFKWINDHLGHSAGDALAVEVARRLKHDARAADTVARFGGDEFVVLCEDVKDENEAVYIAERLAARLSTPMVLEHTEVRVTASIGIAVAVPGRNDTSDALVRDADAAMYQAKARGGDSFELFGEAIRERVQRRLDLESQMSYGIDAGQFEVYYQPQIDLASMSVSGYEALARWNHPHRGEIKPDEFLPVAEHTGLIVPLGIRLLAMACHQAAAWQRAGAPSAISVNLSARQMLSAALPDAVEAILASTGLNPSSLTLDITESVLLADADASRAALGALKNLGIRIAVDDFGTGYASLVYLKTLPVDLLKIDRSFVTGVDRTREDRAIVAGIIDLAHAFGIRTTAEGVETEAQVEALCALGCEEAQGFFWSRALSAEEVLGWVAPVAGSVQRRPAVAKGARRLLLIDDDARLRRAVRAALADVPELIVDEASDGRRGVALAREHQPQIVVLDLAMPGMGGVDALPRIMAVAGDAKVVILSNSDPAEMGEQAFEGAIAYFRKDEDLSRLLGYVEPLLSAGA